MLLENETYNLYLHVIDQAHWRCEKCGTGNGEKSRITRKIVRMHVAHLDHDENNIRRYNLQALCTDCMTIHLKGAVQTVLL